MLSHDVTCFQCNLEICVVIKIRVVFAFVFRSAQHGDSRERFEDGDRQHHDDCHALCNHGHARK